MIKGVIFVVIAILLILPVWSCLIVAGRADDHMEDISNLEKDNLLNSSIKL